MPGFSYQPPRFFKSVSATQISTGKGVTVDTVEVAPGTIKMMWSAGSLGILQIRKGTQAAAVPGDANFLRMYVRDGTNPTTLKLVVIAGTAGAETTILDNIPTA